MNRRDFMKTLGLMGLMASGGISVPAWARAAALKPDFNLPVDLGALPYNKIQGVDKIPRVITLFMQGGASELAGNLSNMGDINMNSVNYYGDEFNPDAVNTVVTHNGLWRTAGGDIMEELLAAKQMSLYRTVHRRKENNRSHGPSVRQNLLGSLDSNSPGMASTIAWLLMQHATNGQGLFAGKALDELMFPFVTFDGENALFNHGSLTLLPSLAPVALSERMQNPFTRSRNWAFSETEFASLDTRLDALASRVSASKKEVEKIHESLQRRGENASSIARVFDAARINMGIDELNLLLPVDQQIDYGNTGFGRRIKAAVSLMLNNEETLFASLGSGGLGGWDDHSDGLLDYPVRMQQMMQGIRAGLRHIEAVKTFGIPRFDENNNSLGRETIYHADNIIINAYGDFGRIVNLNGPADTGGGWDHGNNQNLYTFGGSNIRGADALGKIVGTTQRIGQSKTNAQYTAPTDGSYEFEPFSIASTVYGYFGVQNPQQFNVEPVIIESGSGAPANEWRAHPV